MKKLMRFLLRRLLLNYRVANFVLAQTPITTIRKSLGPDFLSPIQMFHYCGGEQYLFGGMSFDKKSKIVIFGGYLGHSTHMLNLIYGSQIHTYEPIKEYFEILKGRFQNFPNIFLHNLAISDSDKEFVLGKDGERSSKSNVSNMKERVLGIDVANVLENLEMKIDLLEINIEGDEYEILFRLIDLNLIKFIGTLHIQFHKLGFDEEEKRARIRKFLALTHRCEFNFPWVWERWVLVPREFENSVL